MTAHERLDIGSFHDLMHHEKEILRRIAKLPNGGNLFVVHPLRLLSDIGVILTAAARRELLEREPMLAVLADEPYDALAHTSVPQNTRFHVKRLFREVRR